MVRHMFPGLTQWYDTCSQALHSSTKGDLVTCLSQPRPPSKEERGSGRTFFVQVAQSDWLMWQLSYPLGFLTTNHLALLITLLQTHFQFTEASNFKGLAYSRIHSNSRSKAAIATVFNQLHAWCVECLPSAS